MTREQAIEMRRALSAAAQYLSDEDSLRYSFLFPQWKEGEDYKENFKLNYKNQLYKVLQNHTSRVNWEPDEADGILYETVG